MKKSILIIILFSFVSNVFSQDNISINKTGDAYILLNADTDNDNNDETENAFIKFGQDGDQVKGFIGTTGNNDLDPLGSTYIGALDNSLLVGTWHLMNEYPALQFGTANNIRLTILPNGNIGFGTNSPKSKLHLQGTSERMIFTADATQQENSARIEFWETNDPSNSQEASFAIQYDGLHDMLRFKGKKDENNLDFDFLSIKRNGNIGIGTNLFSNPNNYKLAVNGIIGAKEIKVEISSSTWSDFVFRDGYNLRSLKEVENYINKNKHLPDIPTAEEVNDYGINLGEMDAKLLQKIEELTLYIIEQNKQNEALLQRVEQLEKKLNSNN